MVGLTRQMVRQQQHGALWPGLLKEDATSCLGPVISSEAHEASVGANHDTNNTAEISAVIKALCFLSPARTVTRGSQVFIFFDPKHAVTSAWDLYSHAHMFRSA